MHKAVTFTKHTKRALIPVLLMGICLYAAQCKVHSIVVKNTSNSIRTLIVGGGTSHDFDRWYKKADLETLERGGFATVHYTGNTDSILYFLPNIDVLYLANNQPVKDIKVRKGIFDFVNSGKGLVIAHAALWYNWADWPEYNRQLVSGGTRGHDHYGAFDVSVINTSHPVTKGVAKTFTLKDELYHFEPDSAGPGIEVLATAGIAGSGKTYPSVFIVKHPTARIVGLALGHDAASHNIAAYQSLLRNAVKWAAGK